MKARARTGAGERIGNRGMKNIGPVIVIGVLLLGAFVVFMMWGPMAQQPGMRQIEEPPAAETPQRRAGPARSQGAPIASGESGERRSAAGNAQSAGAGAGALATGGSTAASSAAPTAQPPTPNFPSAADISIGMEKSTVVGRYGDPDMVTTAVDRGRLIETYVYLRRDPNTATVVMLRGNRVIGSQTTVY